MIYFDNSATTQMSEQALARYTEVARLHFGNPSSRHFYGSDAKAILEESRQAILKTIGGEKSGTLFFGASGSESNNLAIFGRAYAKERFRGKKILTTAGEHSAVSEPLERLRREGFSVVFIPTAGGVLDMDMLRREMTPDVILVTMMGVNNETGAIYDTAAVAAVMHAQAKDAVLHIDATQSYLKIPFTVFSSGADMITLSSHKIGGPKGVSALYCANSLVKGYGLLPRVLGGGQEMGMRSGTENTPGIAAFAAAAVEGKGALAARAARTSSLRQYIISAIQNAEGGSPLSELKPVLPPKAAPHILSLTLPRIKSETMLNALSMRGICISAGSACSSAHKSLSPALVAFGLSEAEADTTVRVSLSFANTEEECDIFLEALKEELLHLQRIR